MSMLTPPGMGSGKKYRITGERYPRMRRPRRRRRYVLATLATLAALGLLSYGTLQLVEVFQEDGAGGTDQAGQTDATDEQPAECDTADGKPVPLPEPDTVTVNVYNTTERAGLAQDTADTLAERGFTIGEVANVPEELADATPETGLVRGSELAEESGALHLLGSHLSGDAGADPGSETTDRDDAEVDLLLGEDFDELAGEDEVSAALDAMAEAAQPEGEECEGAGAAADDAAAAAIRAPGGGVPSGSHA